MIDGDPRRRWSPELLQMLDQRYQQQPQQPGMPQQQQPGQMAQQQAALGMGGGGQPQQGMAMPPEMVAQMQMMANEPVFRQRQWEQYGSPNANIGMNMAGTAPVGYGAGQWFTPGRAPEGWK
jgi:hypothetical protein